MAGTRHGIYIRITSLTWTQENCYFFCSLIQEHLGGEFSEGKLPYPELAPSIRHRVRECVRLFYHMPAPLTASVVILSTDHILTRSIASDATNFPVKYGLALPLRSCTGAASGASTTQFMFLMSNPPRPMLNNGSKIRILLGARPLPRSLCGHWVLLVIY